MPGGLVMALGCQLRDFTGRTTAEPHGEILRGGQIGFCAGEFGGDVFSCQSSCLASRMARADARKHFAIRRRNPGIGLVDRAGGGTAS